MPPYWILVFAIINHFVFSAFEVCSWHRFVSQLRGCLGAGIVPGLVVSFSSRWITPPDGSAAILIKSEVVWMAEKAEKFLIGSEHFEVNETTKCSRLCNIV